MITADVLAFRSPQPPAPALGTCSPQILFSHPYHVQFERRIGSHTWTWNAKKNEKQNHPFFPVSDWALCGNDDAPLRTAKIRVQFRTDMLRRMHHALWGAERDGHESWNTS